MEEQPPQTTPSENITPQPTAPPAVAAPQMVVVGPAKRPWRNLLLVLLAIITLAGVAAVSWYLGARSSPSSKTAVPASAPSTTSPAPVASQTTGGLTLDSKKSYGNKYQSGLLPVGDGKYTTAAAKKGYVYACSQYAQNLSSAQGGAGSRGPWFVNNNTQYDINKKATVRGSVSWQPAFSSQLSGNTRTITTNDLPSHLTGIFPIGSSDPAYAYDRNPNTIKSQSLTYALTANPVYGQPSCMGGEAGVMLTGVAIFNAFDAGGRDAGAWEVQDGCGGHPEKQGEYHYHTLSSCIKDISVSTVIGYALDGFPFTGPKVGDSNILTTDDLDECHGIVSSIMLDGKQVATYHYVMTQDFPYSVGCFRAKAIQPPGLPQAPAPR